MRQRALLPERVPWIVYRALPRDRHHFPSLVGPAPRPEVLAEGTAGAGYAGLAGGTAEVFEEDGPEPLPVGEPVVVAREAFWAAASGD